MEPQKLTQASNQINSDSTIVKVIEAPASVKPSSDANPGACSANWLITYSPGKVKKLDMGKLWFELSLEAVKQITF